jgi:hypothetical protein
MSSTRIKRAISFAVWGFGLLGSLYGCVLGAEGIFTIGVNDCAQEILAIALAIFTPFLAFIVALWKRLIAGIWLVFAGCYFPVGMLAERNYLIHVRGFTDQVSVGSYLLNSLKISIPLLLFGGSFVVTELLRWPRLLGQKSNSNGPLES